MHCILQEDVPYAAVLVRGMSNKFCLTDLVYTVFYVFHSYESI